MTFGQVFSALVILITWQAGFGTTDSQHRSRSILPELQMQQRGAAQHEARARTATSYTDPGCHATESSEMQPGSASGSVSSTLCHTNDLKPQTLITSHVSPNKDNVSQEAKPGHAVQICCKT